jgi:hypothetical protein
MEVGGIFHYVPTRTQASPADTPYLKKCPDPAAVIAFLQDEIQLALLAADSLQQLPLLIQQAVTFLTAAGTCLSEPVCYGTQLK